MTDTQLLTLAIAIIVPLSMLIYSNTRITEAKETLKANIAELRAEMRTMHAELLAEIRENRQLLKIHELEHHSK
jgi:hypothetical protein